VSFLRRSFSLVKKYEVEFNKAALSLAEGMTNPTQKKAALNRLLKVGTGRTRMQGKARPHAAQGPRGRAAGSANGGEAGARAISRSPPARNGAAAGPTWHSSA
jgi:hypothetical protein